MCLFFEKELEWSGINIEPVAKFYDKLIENRKNSKNINISLSNFDGHTKFTEVNFKNNNSTILGWSSINNWNDLEKRDNTLYTYDTYDVNCVKFSSIFTEKKPIDLFVLDVEGHELEALDGILEIEKQYYPVIFCIEYGHVDKDMLIQKLIPYYNLDEIGEIDIFFKRKY